MEQIEKKKVRAMAGKMLWADFRQLVLGWRVILLLMVFFVFGVWALMKTDEEIFNVGTLFLFVTWMILSIYAGVDKVFNYLPLSEKEVLYYMRYRTWLITRAVVLSYGVLAVGFYVLGIELFWERGVLAMLLLLGVNEMMYQSALFELSPGKGRIFVAALTGKEKAVQIAYFACWMAELIAAMFISMFFKPSENAKYWALGIVAVHFLLLLFRIPAQRSFHFNEYKARGPKRVTYVTGAQWQAEQNLE